MGNLETRGPYPNTLSIDEIIYVDKVGGTPSEDGYVSVQELKDTILPGTNTQILTHDGTTFVAGADWLTLVRGYGSDPVQVGTATSPSSGVVYQYDYSFTTYYRFIADDLSLDAFYPGYSNPVMTGTVVAQKSIAL